MTSVSFSICSLIYIIIFNVVYFGKKRINSLENRIYSALLITTTIGLLIDIIGFISLQSGDATSLQNILIAKIYLIYYFTWAFVLTVYTLQISFKDKYNESNVKKAKMMYIIFDAVILLMPVYIKSGILNPYSYGLAVNFVYFLSAICIGIMVICLILNRKNIKQRKYIPLLALIIGGTLVVTIQKYNPNLLLLTTTESLITALMYFTIENPDMQMVEELSENKKLTEQNYEEKTKFIFKISQDLKKPLQDITNLSNEIIENPKDIEEKIKTININSKQLYTYVNNALDVSKMDINNLKIVETTYNTKNFFEELKLRIKSEIKNSNKNIEFRYEISNSIPEYLQGDNTKLKQIIMSTIYDSIKYTKEGFIELNINTIIKYGICRLMIDISDSGSGMSIRKINEILNVSEKIDSKEQERIDKLDISLPLAHKIIKSLNGSFIIKSEENKGTNFLIIIDQKISENKKEKTKLEKIAKKIINEKKILVVTVDNDIINKIQESFGEYEIINSLYGHDAEERLKKEKFELILIDDELKNESGIEVLKLIKEKTKKPIIIMIDKNKEFISEHYIEDGFTNYVIKQNIEEELKKIK